MSPTWPGLTCGFKRGKLSEHDGRAPRCSFLRATFAAAHGLGTRGKRAEATLNSRYHTRSGFFIFFYNVSLHVQASFDPVQFFSPLVLKFVTVP